MFQLYAPGPTFYLLDIYYFFASVSPLTFYGIEEYFGFSPFALLFIIFFIFSEILVYLITEFERDFRFLGISP